MSLTQKAKEGLEWGVFEVKRRLAAGQTPEKALKRTGIESVTDILFFMMYLKENGHEKLLAKIK